MSSEASTKESSSNLGRDPFWSHGEKVDVKDTNRVRCRYCNQVVSGGISRLKAHLAGLRGNVKACPKVPAEVKSQADAALKSQIASKEAKIARLEVERDEVVIGGSMDSEENSQSYRSLFSKMKTKGPLDIHYQLPMNSVAQTSKSRKMTLGGDRWKKQVREETNTYIARWIYEAGISFNAVSLPSFNHMVEAIGQCGPGLKGPSPYELSEKHLKKEVERTKESLKSFTTICRLNGCSIMTDAWTDRKGRSIMNIMVHCEAGVAFSMSRNVSSDIHDGKFIFDFVDEAIASESGPGAENVVQVVTDNASNNMLAAKMLSLKRPSIFWTSCTAHTINLFLGDIAKIKQIRNAISLGRMMTLFIYGHTISLDLLRQFTKDLDSHELIRPGVTRFAMAFLSLQSILEKKKEIRNMFSSQKWEDSKLARTPHGKRVAAIVYNVKFWKDAEIAVSIFAPLVKVLRRADGDAPSMGWIYGDMLKAKDDIAIALNRNESRYLPIWKLIERRTDSKLSTPLHIVGHYLNPYFYFANWEKMEKDGKYMNAVIECMSKMYGRDVVIQDRIAEQVCLYRNQKGSFGREIAKRQSLNCYVDLVNWWKFNGNDAPDLRDMAVRILGLTTSSSGCERNWSTFELIHTKKRNRLDHKKLNDLVFVKFNATIKTRSMEAKRDPIAAKNFDDGKVMEWLVGSSSTKKCMDVDDEEDEVFPGEGLTWQQVAECMEGDTEPRKSSRQPSKTAYTKSTKGKGKRKSECIAEEDEVELSASSEEDVIEDDISEGDYETDNDETATHLERIDEE